MSFRASSGGYSTVALRETDAPAGGSSSFSPLGSDDAVRPLPQHSWAHWWASLSLKVKLVLALTVVGVVVGVGVGSAAAARKKGGAAPSVCSWSDYRLPTNVRPLSYGISWSPLLTPDSLAYPLCSDASGCPFNGTTVVDVQVLAESPCILIHSAGLRVASATIQNLNSAGSLAYAATWTEDAVNERLVVSVPGSVGAVPGVQLRLTFTFGAPMGTTKGESVPA